MEGALPGASSHTAAHHEQHPSDGRHAALKALGEPLRPQIADCTPHMHGSGLLRVTRFCLQLTDVPAVAL